MTNQETRFPDCCDAEARAQLQKMRTGYYEVPAYHRRWSTEETALLFSLANAGYGISFIAVKLGRSELSVVSKMRSLSIFKPVYKNRKEREAKAQADQMEG